MQTQPHIPRANTATSYRALMRCEEGGKASGYERAGMKSQVERLSAIKNPCVRDEILLHRYRKALAEIEGK